MIIDFLKKLYRVFIFKEETSADALSNIINENNYKTYAEIGVFNGGTAERILSCTQLGKAYLIDPYTAYDDNGTASNETDTALAKARNEAYRRNKKYKAAEFLYLPSLEAAKQFKDNSIDIVFIDAAHTYKDCKADIEAWLPKVRTGGVVSGHDFGWRFKGVVEAVVEKFDMKKVHLTQGKVWWLKKE